MLEPTPLLSKREQKTLSLAYDARGSTAAVVIARMPASSEIKQSH